MIKKVKASAPGKVTLFGEHAVVYGHPAIATAISSRASVTVERRSDDLLVVSSPNLPMKGISLVISGKSVSARVEASLASRALAYVVKALEVAERELDMRRTGLNIVIESDMPVSAGLGTSASITVATLLAYTKLRGYELDRRELARMGHRVELEVQGAASPMDTATASNGGTLLIEPDRSPPYQPLKAGKLPVVIGYTQREGTTASLVARVKELYREFPEIVEGIMSSIGNVVKRAVSLLEKSDYKALGQLMTVNHYLLGALGVSTRRLDEMVHAALLAGAYGAKLTGAGGGGAMIALVDPGNPASVASAIKAAGGSIIEAETDSPGARIESVEIDG